MKKKRVLKKAVFHYGRDILPSSGKNDERTFIQHGATSVYDHTFNVAYLSMYIAVLLRLKVNQRALVRGALLHDYCKYDWHNKDKSHRFHGFTHAKKARENAEKDFELGEIEKNIIERHMFPLNIVPPKFKEGFIVCIADKISAVSETLGKRNSERFHVEFSSVNFRSA